HGRHRRRAHGTHQRVVVRLARCARPSRHRPRRSAAIRAGAGGFRAAADVGHRARRASPPGLLMADDPVASEDPAGERGTTVARTPGSRWEYVGVGCFTMVAGIAGGWMIAILVAKFVGALTRCPAEAETGAPCNWFTFAVLGALAGALTLPAIS